MIALSSLIDETIINEHNIFHYITKSSKYTLWFMKKFRFYIFTTRRRKTRKQKK